MKSPADMLEPIATRGDFRQLAKSTPHGKPPERDTDQPDLEPEHWLWEVWHALSEFYGAAFVRQYGAAPRWAWLEALQDLSLADLGEGIRSLKNRADPFPPNPGEFRALCRPVVDPQHQRQAQTVAALPRPEPLPPERALEQIRRIRERCGL